MADRALKNSGDIETIGDLKAYIQSKAKLSPYEIQMREFLKDNIFPDEMPLKVPMELYVLLGGRLESDRNAAGANINDRKILQNATMLRFIVDSVPEGNQAETRQKGEALLRAAFDQDETLQALITQKLEEKFKVIEPTESQRKRAERRGSAAEGMRIAGGSGPARGDDGQSTATATAEAPLSLDERRAGLLEIKPIPAREQDLGNIDVTRISDVLGLKELVHYHNRIRRGRGLLSGVERFVTTVNQMPDDFPLRFKNDAAFDAFARQVHTINEAHADEKVRTYELNKLLHRLCVESAGESEIHVVAGNRVQLSPELRRVMTQGGAIVDELRKKAEAQERAAGSGQSFEDFLRDIGSERTPEETPEEIRRREEETRRFRQQERIAYFNANKIPHGEDAGLEDQTKGHLEEQFGKVFTQIERHTVENFSVPPEVVSEWDAQLKRACLEYFAIENHKKDGFNRPVLTKDLAAAAANGLRLISEGKAGEAHGKILEMLVEGSLRLRDQMRTYKIEEADIGVDNRNSIRKQADMLLSHEIRAWDYARLTRVQERDYSRHRESTLQASMAITGQFEVVSESKDPVPAAQALQIVGPSESPAQAAPRTSNEALDRKFEALFEPPQEPAPPLEILTPAQRREKFYKDNDVIYDDLGGRVKNGLNDNLLSKVNAALIFENVRPRHHGHDDRWTAKVMDQTKQIMRLAAHEFCLPRNQSKPGYASPIFMEDFTQIVVAVADKVKNSGKKSVKIEDVLADMTTSAKRVEEELRSIGIPVAVREDSRGPLTRFGHLVHDYATSAAIHVSGAAAGMRRRTGSANSGGNDNLVVMPVRGEQGVDPLGRRGHFEAVKIPEPTPDGAEAPDTTLELLGQLEQKAAALKAAGKTIPDELQQAFRELHASVGGSISKPPERDVRPPEKDVLGDLEEQVAARIAAKQPLPAHIGAELRTLLEEMDAGTVTAESKIALPEAPRVEKIEEPKPEVKKEEPEEKKKTGFSKSTTMIGSAVAMIGGAWMCMTSMFTKKKPPVVGGRQPEKEEPWTAGKIAASVLGVALLGGGAYFGYQAYRR